jgi:hypothetical protein
MQEQQVPKGIETITIPKDEFEKITEIVKRAVEFERLGEILPFAISVMGDMKPEAIVAQINHRTLILTNAALWHEEPMTVEQYRDMIVKLAIQLIFLSGQLGIDLVSAINNQMTFEKEQVKARQEFERVIAEDQGQRRDTGGGNGNVIPLNP